jgi:hypothetical protein
MMRNLAGGFLGVAIGSYLIVALVGFSPPEPAYPSPLNLIWAVFIGSQALRSTLQTIFQGQIAVLYLVTWLLIGLVIAPFSRKGWNTVRTAVWVGVTLAIMALVGQLFENPTYWDITLNPLRNYDLIYQFSISIVTSLLTLLSAIPLTMVIDKARQTGELPIPEKIETRCNCGAVFKSNPLICSECGATLRQPED